MTASFQQGFLAGAAWAAHVADVAAERIVSRPPSPDYERDGPRVRGDAAHVLRALADALADEAPGALAEHEARAGAPKAA